MESAHKKLFLSVIGICFGLVVTATLFSMLNTALPSIYQDLHTTLAELQWVMNIFGILTCSCLVTVGRLADMIGRKKIFILGLLSYGISLLGSGLSNHIQWIIFFQSIAGIGNAILLSVSQAMLTHEFPDDQKNRAIGIWTATVGLSLAVGPLLGGLITSMIGWRWIFLAPFPAICISFVLVSLFSSESKNTKDPAQLDVIGAVLLTLTISLFSLAVIQGGIWPSSLIASLYILSMIALVILLIFEKSAPMPIIREDLFTNSRFVLASLANCCLIFFVWAAFFLMPLFFQSLAGLNGLETGLLMLFVTLPLFFLSGKVSTWSQKYPPKYLIIFGCFFLILSAVLQLFFEPQSSWLLFALAALALGIAWSFTWGPTISLALSTLGKENAGIASGSFITVQEIGGTLGLAITVAVARDRLQFLDGFHDSMFILILIGFIGLASGLMLKK